MRRFRPPCQFVVFAAAIAAFTALLPVASAAQPTTTDVERLIKRGNELRTAGRDQQALPLYQKAYEVARTPRTAAQLGLCEMALNYWMAADGHLSEAVAGRGDWIDKNRSAIETSLRQVQKQIGEVIVSGTPAGASVFIGAKEVGTLPMAPLRVATGQIRIEVRAPGYQDRSEAVVVVGGTQERVSLHLSPDSASVTRSQHVERPPEPRSVGGLGDRPPSRDQPSTWSAGKIGGVVLVAVGIAAIATGAVMLRNRTAGCSAPVGAVCDRGQPSEVPGWGLMGGGVAAGVVGAVLFFSSRDTQVSLAPTRQSLVLSLRGSL